MSTSQPIRNKNHLHAFTHYWLAQGNLRNYLLIVFALYSALRISDLLRLTWLDVYDHSLHSFYSHISLIEHKTGKFKTFPLNPMILHALKLYFPFQQHNYLFPSNRNLHKPISRIQAWRIIQITAIAVHIPDSISCHSLRKTFGYHAWKQGAHPSLIMDIYNHSSYSTTRRYLGISQDDLDDIYLNISFF